MCISKTVLSWTRIAVLLFMSCLFIICIVRHEMSDEMMSATRTPIAGMIVGMTVSSAMKTAILNVITTKMSAILNAMNASLTEDGDIQFTLKDKQFNMRRAANSTLILPTLILLYTMQSAS